MLWFFAVVVSKKMTKTHKKRLLENPKAFENHRGDVIRTRDLYVPNVALYQAEPHPEVVRHYTSYNF